MAFLFFSGCNNSDENIASSNPITYTEEEKVFLEKKLKNSVENRLSLNFSDFNTDTFKVKLPFPLSSDSKLQVDFFDNYSNKLGSVLLDENSHIDFEEVIFESKVNLNDVYYLLIEPKTSSIVSQEIKLLNESFLETKEMKSDTNNDISFSEQEKESLMQEGLYNVEDNISTLYNFGFIAMPPKLDDNNSNNSKDVKHGLLDYTKEYWLEYRVFGRINRYWWYHKVNYQASSSTLNSNGDKTNANEIYVKVEVYSGEDALGNRQTIYSDERLEYNIDHVGINETNYINSATDNRYPREIKSWHHWKVNGRKPSAWITAHWK
jgi:hypothetical protein